MILLCVYSQAVLVDNTMYISGCLGMDPVSSNLVEGGIEPEANQVVNVMQTNHLWPSYLVIGIRT